MTGQFVFVGGKGGVGKTTVASALAVDASRAGEQTLLVSTDPAHSTRDVFGQQFTGTPMAVPDRQGLFVLELDPNDEVDRHMQDIRQRMTEQVSAGIVNELEQQLELAHETPGAYESALFDRFIEIMETEGDNYDTIVFDTAPTGGTLRLLTLPNLLGGWISRLIDKRAESLDLFEKAAIGAREPRRTKTNDPIINHLQRRQSRFEFAHGQLQDNAQFYLVLNPDRLSINETERALQQLTDAAVSVDGLIVNKLTPAPDTGESGTGAEYLRKRRSIEQDRIDQIEADLAPPVVARIESRPQEISGEQLDAVASQFSFSR